MRKISLWIYAPYFIAIGLVFGFIASLYAHDVLLAFCLGSVFGVFMSTLPDESNDSPFDRLRYSFTHLMNFYLVVATLNFATLFAVSFLIAVLFPARYLIFYDVFISPNLSDLLMIIDSASVFLTIWLGYWLGTIRGLRTISWQTNHFVFLTVLLMLFSYAFGLICGRTSYIFTIAAAERFSPVGYAVGMLILYPYNRWAVSYITRPLKHP